MGACGSKSANSSQDIAEPNVDDVKSDDSFPEEGIKQENAIGEVNDEICEEVKIPADHLVSEATEVAEKPVEIASNQFATKAVEAVAAEAVEIEPKAVEVAEEAVEIAQDSEVVTEVHEPEKALEMKSTEVIESPQDQDAVDNSQEAEPVVEVKSVEVTKVDIALKQDAVIGVDETGTEEKVLNEIDKKIGEKKDIIDQNDVEIEECVLCTDERPKVVEIKLDSVQVLEQVRSSILAADSGIACVLDEPPEISVLRKYFTEEEASCLSNQLPEKLLDADALDKYLNKMKTLFFDKVADKEDGISPQKYKTILKTATKKESAILNEEVKKAMQQYDLDGDGTLNFYEFAKMTISKDH